MKTKWLSQQNVFSSLSWIFVASFTAHARFDHFWWAQKWKLEHCATFFYFYTNHKFRDFAKKFFSSILFQKICSFMRILIMHSDFLFLRVSNLSITQRILTYLSMHLICVLCDPMTDVWQVGLDANIPPPSNTDLCWCSLLKFDNFCSETWYANLLSTKNF